MKSRSIYLALLLAVAGGFVVLTTFAFAQGTANAIDFAISIGVTVAALAGAVDVRSGGRRYVVAAGATALIGAWTILVTLGIFSGAAQQWLVFASGAAITAISLATVVSAVSQRGRRLVAYEAATQGTNGVAPRAQQPATF